VKLPPVELVLTFDYELYHGRNLGSYEEVLFGPTERILERCEEIGVPAVLFPDVCSVWAHRRFGLSEYADRFEAQLRDAVRRGHDVQLHVHPHWLFSSFEDGEWRVDASRLQLQDLPFDASPEGAPAAIRQGAAYLEDLLRKEDPDYRCLAFRAAALALQPREDELLAALLAAGITIDSTVAKGVRSRTDTFVMDYAKAPARANWSMRPGSGLAEAPGGDGSVWEVPLATFRVPLARRAAFLARRLRAMGERRGTTMSRGERQTPLGSLWHLALMNLRYLTGNPWFVLSCDTKGFDLRLLLDGFEEHLERHREEPSIAVAMINHPKLMFDAQIDLLAGFVDAVRRRHGPGVRFTTFRALAEAGAGREGAPA
jgi:hypothetical protein